MAVGAVVVGLNVLISPGASGSCTVTLADGTAVALDGDQAANAALLSGVALRRELPARAVTIAIATALQESKLRNIDYGDRDSVGLFQQRPSQGWGTVEQIMDPVYATNAFYDVLVTVQDWEGQEITEAAQNVQRSAFPDAYAQHEDRGRGFASALSGYSAAALTCDLPADTATDGGTGATGAAAAATGQDPTVPQRLARVAERVERDLGLTATVTAGGVLAVDATALPGGRDPSPDRLGWAVAHWAVATATDTGAEAVVVDGRAWVRADEEGWTAAAEADLPEAVAAAAGAAAPGVVVVLA
ncbi:hypothetical protein [Georgenia muralis]